MLRLRSSIAKDNGKTLIFVFVLTCILNVYNLANFEISVDDEVHYLGGGSVATWWYSIGRWGAGILSSISPHSFVVPFATSLTFCISLAASYLLLCEIHCIRERWKILSALPLFILFPSWEFIESFYSVLPAVSLGLLLTVFAAYLTRELSVDNSFMPKRPKMVLVTLTCLVVAIGCYQSLVLLFFAIGVGSTLLSLWQLNIGRTRKQSAWSQLFPFALFSIAGSLISVLVGKLMQMSLGIPRSPYLDNFLKIQNLSITMWPRNLLSVAREVINYFGGREEVYGDWFISFLFLTLSSCLVLISSKSDLSRTRPAWIVIILFAVLVSSPFFFSLVGGGLPTRSLLSLPYVAWIIGVVAITKIQQNQYSFLVNAALALVVATTIIQSIYINGAYSAASFLVDRHDSLLAASIYNRLNSIENNDNPDSLIFLGVKGRINYVSPFPTGRSSTIGASIFDWDGGNPNRMIAYMNMLGYNRIKLLDVSTVHSKDEELKEMNTWPSLGSLAKIGENEYLLKLSSD